jgi:hypothetical protein
MGELDDPGGYEPEWLPEATDPTAIEDATPIPGASVTSRFFNPDGSAKEVPELRTEAGFLAFYEGQVREQEAVEALRGPDATRAFDEGPRSEQEAYGDFVASSQAAQAHNMGVFNAEILSRVTEAGKAANVRDSAALEQVAGDALQSIAEWSQHELARGASGRQVWAAMGEPAFGAWLDERIGEGLQQASYDAAVQNTQMRKWAARSWEAQRVNFELGVGPEPSTPWQRYPELRKMWAGMQAHAARAAERDAQMDAIKQRSRSYTGPRSPAQTIRRAR